MHPYINEDEPIISNLFEVQIIDGPLVWSKKECKKYPQSDADFIKLFAKIRAAHTNEQKSNAKK